MQATSLIRVLLSFLPLLVRLGLTQTEGSMRHVLNLHNFYRREAAWSHQVANMNKLSWSDRLAANARELVRCSSWRNRQRARLARANINVGKIRTNVSLALDLLIASWYSQRRYVVSGAAGHDGCSRWYKCLEYRAMLNAHHHSMGCALLPSCGRRRHYSVFMCIYEGGSANEAVFNFLHGPLCSKCGGSLAFCEDGLCAGCSEPDVDRCECRKTCYEEGVGRGRLNSTACTCDCEYGLGPNCDEPCRNPPNVLGLNVCQISYNRNTDAELGALTPLDCQRFGHFCPEQCLCSPWPRSREPTVPDSTELIYVDPEDDSFLSNATELTYVDPQQDALSHLHHQTDSPVHDENDDVSDDVDDVIVYL